MARQLSRGLLHRFWMQPFAVVMIAAGIAAAEFASFAAAVLVRLRAPFGGHAIAVACTLVGPLANSIADHTFIYI